MSDQAALDLNEAIEEAVGFYDGIEEAMPEAFQVLVGNARRYAAGTPLRWCETHERPATETTCGAFVRDLSDEVNYNLVGGVRDCSIVERWISDPPENS